jgi:hypothetical protein
VEPGNISISGQVTNPLCFGDTDGEIDITLSGGTPPFNYLWDNGQMTEDLVNLGVGAYEVTAEDANGCKSVQSYQISTPTALTTNVTVLGETCYGQDDGVIELNTSGGWGAYQYNWSNGAVGPENQDLATGTYDVTITDAFGCSDVQTGMVIEGGPQVNAGYTVLSSTVYLDDGGSLQFTNISIGGLQYVWDFGTGQSSIQTNPLYTFVTTGNYNVQLTAFSGVCYSTSSNIITVEAGVGVEKNGKEPEGFITFEANGQLNLNLGSFTTNKVDVQIHNALGQLVYSFADIAVVEQHIVLNIGSLQRGVYIVRLINGDMNLSQKFTID